MIKQQYIDYFKLFKIYQTKKLQKIGQVKILQDKNLMRKVLSCQGNVSTENYTTLVCSNYPNILFKHQYLYLLAYCDPGKAFTFQITYFLSSRQYKIVCSTMYKEEFKKKGDGLFWFRLKMPSDKWTVVAIDLYSLVNWDQTFKNDQDLRLGFRIASIEIRANSKVRGMFQSDQLYGPQNLPKDMELPLRGEENFFDKYAFVVTGLNVTEELKNEIVKMKENVQVNEGEMKKQQKLKGKLSKEKSQQKMEKKNLSRQKPRVSEQKGKQQKKPLVPKSIKTQKSKKPQSTQPQHQQQHFINDTEQELLQQQTLQPPVPAASLNLKISTIEGLSLIYQNIISCGSFLIEPVMLATHKKITRICKGRNQKVLVAYADGSVCLWDTIRKETGVYFRSELEEIKCMVMDHEGNIVIVGLDKLKRQVITIVSQQAIIFKQISTFNIKTLYLINNQSFQHGLISIGYQNIRLWTISPTNNIINGYSVYLGKMARGVTYNDCCVVETVAGTYAFVADSEGYVTKVAVGEKKMEGVVKVDSTGLDHIRLVKYLNNEQKILIVNDKGIVKLLNCTTMESELQFALNNRIKSLWLKQNPQNQDIPNLLLQSYTKTIAELDLVSSTLHYNTRSHYQPVTHIQYEKSKSRNSSFIEDKIITASLDSTLRVWKLIKISDTDVALKEEYEFLINSETINHICVSPGNTRTAQGFVYMITDTNKIRKISLASYQIVKEKTLPVISATNSKNTNSMMKVLSLAINTQGKVLLIVCDQQLLIMDQELEVLQYKTLQSDKVIGKKNGKNSKGGSNEQRYICGFNSHKKSFYFYNPHSQCIQFYHLKDLQTPIFSISSPPTQMILNLQWDNELIHCITSEEYQLYERDSLLRVLPFKNDYQLTGNSVTVNCVRMNYPLLCVSYELKETGESFVWLQVVNRPGLSQRIKVPERISQLKLTKPFNAQSSTQTQGISSKHQTYNWQGEIICAGEQSHSMYALQYAILNMPNIAQFNSQISQYPTQDQRTTISFLDQKSQRNMRIPKIQNANISFITHAKDEPMNNLDISFSQTATLLLGNNFTGGNNGASFRRNNFINSQLSNQGSEIMRGAPTQLRKLYEEEEKVFEQCKKAVFGNFFDNQEEIQEEQGDECVESHVQQEEQQERVPESGKIKMKMFFGLDSRQSLKQDIQSLDNNTLSSYKKPKQQPTLQLGSFPWSSSQKQITLLTNTHKSLLVHQFTQPSITQRLIHLYSKPSSICWSHQNHQSAKQSSQQIFYYIVCYNSIIKLYNGRNKMGYIRSIENQVLVKDKHVVFSSFVSSCNGFLVVMTYRLMENSSKQLSMTNSKNNNKLYIFVLQLSSGKIISSSYRTISTNPKSKLDTHLRQSYQLKPNRFSTNNQLEFILISPNELSFYRVTSMFTLQMLELDDIKLMIKEKTQSLVSSEYVKIEGDVYLLIGTQNGSLIVVDSRSGALILVLVNLLTGKASNQAQAINKIEFIPQGPYIDGEPSSYSKLIFSSKSSNSLKVITLTNGINTLIQEVEMMNSTTVVSSNHSLSGYDDTVHNHQQQHSMLQCINLDSEITSVSMINNSTQQLVLTKSSTLWLVDYDDLCSIKIFAAHSQLINQAYLLRNIDNHNSQNSAKDKTSNPSNQHFITCSLDGYVKISDCQKLQQHVQIYKPRKPANCLQINGSYTVCGFKDELYFYDSISENVTQFNYLGSLQVENQTVLKVKNIPFSHNYYLLTDAKLYIIYVKRKQSANYMMGKSSLSMQQSQVSKALGNSQVGTKGTTLPKVHIQIEIQQITAFSQSQHSKQSPKPLWLEINTFKPYDQFSIGFTSKVQTWQRKCLKRTLNPLDELSHVQSLQYYLTDVYNRKQTLEPYIQFISQRQYMISLSQLNKIQIRNYKDHAVIKEINFSQQFLQGIKTFRYFVMPEKKGTSNNHHLLHQNDKQKLQGKAYFNHLANFKKGPLIILGDQFGYLSVCDMNGLVIEKEKVFNSPIESIEVHPEVDSQKVAFSVFVKSSHFVSFLNVYH